MAHLTLEDRGQLDAFKAVTVKHAHLTRVDDQLSLWVEEHTDATHVLLCGPGGVGKSKILSSLEMEARAGEHRVALHDSESAKQFQALVKKTVKAANGKAEPKTGSVPGVSSADRSDEIAKPHSATLPMPQVAPKASKPRVGQRTPERDPVGETAASKVGKAIGCSFTEETPVTLAQIREAGVSRFECPTCLAVRDIQPKGNRVKFPWHPKRTTTTPNHGERWVRRGSIWELADST